MASSREPRVTYTNSTWNPFLRAARTMGLYFSVLRTVSMTNE
jgi:hypothetical protein